MLLEKERRKKKLHARHVQLSPLLFLWQLSFSSSLLRACVCFSCFSIARLCFCFHCADSHLSEAVEGRLRYSYAACLQEASHLLIEELGFLCVREAFSLVELFDEEVCSLLVLDVEDVSGDLGACVDEELAHYDADFVCCEERD